MTTTFSRTTLVAAVALAALTLGGCAPSTADGTTETPAASAAPTASEPPSTPVVQTTLRDEVEGTTVTPLAMVTDFPSPEGSTAGVHPVLVKVRVEASDEFDTSVFPSVVSITPRDANLDYITLGMSNPDVLTSAMNAAGYPALSAVPGGETSTAWIGAWVNDGGTEFDLVYDRREATVFGGSRDGEKLAPSQAIAQLVAE